MTTTGHIRTDEATASRAEEVQIVVLNTASGETRKDQSDETGSGESGKDQSDEKTSGESGKDQSDEAIRQRSREAVRIKLLRAIQNEDKTSVQALLREWQPHVGGDITRGHTQCTEDFPTDLPPTLLALEVGNIDIAKMVIAMEEFHPLTTEACTRYSCTCKKNYRKDYGASVSLEESRQRIYAYRTMCHPAFICLNNQTGRLPDPVLEAFKLSVCMRALSDVDPVYSAEYTTLNSQVTQFAVELLSHCHTNQEVLTIMRETAGADDVYIGGKEQTFSRVYLAVACQQTRFVTHPNCQQILRQKWYEGVETWEQWSLWLRAAYVMIATLLMPFLLIAYMIPALPFVPLMRYPLNKFIFNTVTLFSFLICVCVDAFAGVPFQLDDLRSSIRYYMFFWVLGATARMVKIAYRRRRALRLHFQSKTRVYDIVMLAFYWIAFAIGLHSMIWCPEVTSSRLEGTCKSSLGGEVFLSIGHVMACGRVVSFFKIFSVLGTLQISVGRMFNDILRFIFLFLIVMWAFGVGIFKLHHILQEQIGKNGTRAMENEDSGLHFASFPGTYSVLFWSLFGYGEPNVASLQKDHTDSSSDKAHLKSVYDMIQFPSFLLFGLYHVMAVIMLINMVIAMMANTYNHIAQNADIEWKFARAKLWMDYFDDYGTLPPPFNLIPIRQIVKIAASTCRRCQSCKDNNSNSDEKADNKDSNKYKKLMQRLVKRYLEKVNLTPLTPEYPTRRLESRKCQSIANQSPQVLHRLTSPSNNLSGK